MAQHVEIKIEPGGRVVLPASVREAIGLQPGGIAVVRIEGDHILVMSREAVHAQHRDLFTPAAAAMTADDLVVERRVEEASASASKQQGAISSAIRTARPVRKQR